MTPVAVQEKSAPFLQPKVQQPAVPLQKDDIVENYEGSYKFAPITEAEVSRAMIKRYASRTRLSKSDMGLFAIGTGTSTLCMSAPFRTLLSSVPEVQD